MTTLNTIIIGTENEFQQVIPMFRSILQQGNEISFINANHECQNQFDELVNSPAVSSSYSFFKINIQLKKTAMNFLIQWYKTHKDDIPYNYMENLTGQFFCPSCHENTI